jgi:soluble lytic murein transglycosylase-like protein
MLTNENKYDSIIITYAASNSLDWLLLKAQIKQESRFNPSAVSKVGAKGLAQFMPSTWQEWGQGQDIYSPAANISAQARYMAYLVKQFNGDTDKALAAYNFGIGNVKRARPWPKETQNYVRLIKMYYNQYKKGLV